MSDEEPSHSIVYVIWEIIIFVAAIASVLAVAIELSMHLPEDIEHTLRTIDFIAIILFTIDLGIKYRSYRHHSKNNTQFLMSNWLDIIAIIPIFRVFRLGRFARISKISKVTKTIKATKVLSASEKMAVAGEKSIRVGEKTLKAVEKGYKGVAGVAHGKHGKHAIEKIKKD